MFDINHLKYASNVKKNENFYCDMRHGFKNFSTEIPKLSDVRETFFSESILMKQGLGKKESIILSFWLRNI